jgi:hypothetical protein
VPNPAAPTSIARQSLAQLGGRTSVLARQRHDHVELDRILRAMDATPTGTDAHAELLTRLCRLVFPHAFAEESVLWPVMRRALPDGHALTLEVELEHQEVNELVTRLERPDLAGDERERVLARLADVLREDVRDEEDVLLPRLQAVLDRRTLRLLGVAWEVVRRVAPTRAHPVVARRPPGNVLAALPLTVLDHSRDALDRGARRGPARLAPALRTASRGLARAAHGVERLPLLRVGEDVATAR